MEGTAVSADGVAITFETMGAGASALVFVHGWSCDRSYWSNQLEPFAERHQVVTIDLGGHGASGLGRVDYTMAAFGEDVAAVVRALDVQEAILVGHSMGGDVIIEAALRLSGIVTGLVWIDAYRRLGAPRSPEQVEEVLGPLRADFASAVKDLVRRLCGPQADEAFREAIAADMASAPPEVAISALGHAITFEPALVEALARLELPMFAINPDDKPTDVEALARHGIETVLIHGVGHFAMMEDPASFNTRLEDVIERLSRAVPSR